MQFAEQAILVEEPPLAATHNFCPDQERCGLLREALSQKAEIEA